MGRAELLLALMSIAIFGRFSLTVNSTLLESSAAVLISEFEMNAMSAADNIIMEAWSRKFDEAVLVTVPSDLPDDFTAYSSLGPETGETYPNFDDIDDYDGLSIADTTSTGFVFNIAVTVGYVDTSDLNTYDNDEQFYKRMDVTITSVYLDTTLTLNHVFSFVRD